MRNRTFGLALAAGALLLAPAAAQAQDIDACWFRGTTAAAAADRPSPPAAVAIPMGDEAAQLCYARPSARGRKVMGGLVPFGSPWRTGANEATQLHLPFDAKIGGVDVPAGVYSLYTVPGEDEWEIMLSTNYERWGVPINASVRSAEVASFTRSVAQMDEMVEQFTVRWDAHGAMMGHLVMEWEHTRVEIPIHHGSMGH